MTVGSTEAPASTGRLGEWRDLIREHFVSLEVDAAAPDAFSGEVHTVEVGSLRVAEVSSVPQRAERTASLARRDTQRYFQAGLLVDGRASLDQDGRTCQLEPGDFAVYETERPFRWTLGDAQSGRWRLLVFTWPRIDIALPERRSSQLTARQLSGRAGLSGVVSRTLRDLAHHATAIAADPGGAVAGEIAGLTVTAAEAAMATSTEIEATLLDRIEDFLLRHLGDPTLCPDTIAAAHFISTRHLHRLFAQRGRSVGQWLREQRLERCRHDLATSTAPVAEICRRWGFRDPAVFSRAFRAAYGVAPSRYGPRAAPGE